jgi:hypothetical protein
MVEVQAKARADAIARSAPECPLCHGGKMQHGNIRKTDNGRIFVSALLFLLFGGLWFAVVLVLAVGLGLWTGNLGSVLLVGCAGSALLVYLLWKFTQVDKPAWICSLCGHHAEVAPNSVRVAIPKPPVVQPKVPPRPPMIRSGA